MEISTNSINSSDRERLIDNDNDDDAPVKETRVEELVEEVVVDRRVLWYSRDIKIFLTPIDMSEVDFHHHMKKIDYIAGFPVVLLVDTNSAVIKLIGIEDSNVASIDLDLMGSVSKMGTTTNSDYFHVVYNYTRKSLTFALNVIFPILKEENNIDETLGEFEFIFKQFTLWTLIESDFNQAQEDNRKPNSVARGLENGGVWVRQGIKAGGRSTGDAIRYLGKKYTDNTLSWKMRDSVADENKDDVKDPIRSATRLVEKKDVDKALKMKDRGESVHAGIRTFTSTALRPIRYLGEKASTLATIRKEDEKDKNRPIMDTIGGIGNAAASIFKGFTEALTEIGEATSEAAMHHSRNLYGDEYANSVTQHYVDGYGEIGLGLYKGLNVVSFGIHGLMIDAVVEGTMLSISLYEFLVGPVLFQDYIELITLPSLEKKSFFFVLRPWSLAFYDTASDFCRRPKKIIPTSMLDTIPKMRGRKADGSANDPSLLTKLKGTESHIELCTIDGSSYLLVIDSLIEKLMLELELASKRVETIEKRESGAIEIAIERRLSMLPKTHFIKILIKEVILAPNLVEDDNQDIYELSADKTKIEEAGDSTYLPLASDEVSADRKTTPTSSNNLAGLVNEKITELKYNFYKSCELQILPTTPFGVGIVNERITTALTELHQVENEACGCSANFSDDPFLLGKNACLAPAECRALQFSLHCSSNAVMAKIKVASATVLISKITASENLWIDLKKKGKIMAKVLIDIQLF